TAGFAIYDTMQLIRPDIATYSLGMAASAAPVLLSAGTPGKRNALPNARMLIHQPATDGPYTQVYDPDQTDMATRRKQRQTRTATSPSTSTRRAGRSPR